MGRKLTLILFGVLLLAACARKAKLGDTAVLSVQVPHLNHARVAIPGGRKACYGINVTGTKIPTVNGSTCSPPTGLLGGYVDPGQTIEIDNVTRDQTVTVQLFLYLEDIGENVPCPTLTPAFTNTQLAKTTIAATSQPTVVNQDIVPVNLTTNWPGPSTNITQQLSMSAACRALASVTSLSPTPFSISAGGEINLTGTNVKMRAHAGSTYQRPVLTGTGVKLIVR